MKLVIAPFLALATLSVLPLESSSLSYHNRNYGGNNYRNNYVQQRNYGNSDRTSNGSNDYGNRGSYGNTDRTSYGDDYGNNRNYYGKDVNRNYPNQADYVDDKPSYREKEERWRGGSRLKTDLDGPGRAEEGRSRDRTWGRGGQQQQGTSRRRSSSTPSSHDHQSTRAPVPSWDYDRLYDNYWRKGWNDDYNNYRQEGGRTDESADYWRNSNEYEYWGGDQRHSPYSMGGNDDGRFQRQGQQRDNEEWQGQQGQGQGQGQRDGDEWRQQREGGGDGRWREEERRDDYSNAREPGRYQVPRRYRQRSAGPQQRMPDPWDALMTGDGLSGRMTTTTSSASSSSDDDAGARHVDPHGTGLESQSGSDVNSLTNYYPRRGQGFGHGNYNYGNAGPGPYNAGGENYYNDRYYDDRRTVGDGYNYNEAPYGYNYNEAPYGYGGYGRPGGMRYRYSPYQSGYGNQYQSGYGNGGYNDWGPAGPRRY